MGYYSDVYIKCKKEKAFEFKQFLHNFKKTYNIDLRNEEQFSTTNDFIYLKLIGWKFYTAIDQVKTIIDFINSEKMENTIGGIAVGEDNYIERYGNCYEVDLYEIVVIEGMNE